MESWYSVVLGDGITAAQPSSEVESVFRSLFLAAGSPPEMAVFTRLESEGRLHCEVTAYFSPSAWEVAKAFEAEPCPIPERSGLSLLAGNLEAWSALFPERGG